MIDTHTHPYLEQFKDGGVEVVNRALENGVTHLILPNVDLSTLAPMMELHEKFPDFTSVAMGLHPTEVGDGWENIVDRMEALLESGDFVAVGEVGIDLYWEKERKEDQIRAFRRQLEIAERLRLPVIIHNREATAETVGVIRDVKPTVPLVFHSFSGGPEVVKSIREVCDPMFGINGVVTFRNAEELRLALPEIGLDRILLETDAPYLAPVPFRGRRNEPSYVVYTRDKIAEVLGISPEEVEKATDDNAKKTFFR